MKKKFIVALGVSAVLLANPLSFSYAKNELVEGRALSMAHQYIENSLSDEAWAGNNPVISAQSKFYTDDAKKVSYIEYKVSCDTTPDCGFIMMNVDGNDVSVPIASPTGNTPSEILDQGTDVSEKLYYFGPFDLYSENEVTGNVQALNPQLAVDLRDDTQVKRSKEEKEANKLAREALKTKLKEAKLAAKEFKKSEEFKKQKEEIKDQILNVPKEEFSMKILDMGYAANYTSPGASDIFVAGASSNDCGSRIPCYSDYYPTGLSCKAGCTPVAIGMIYGYYDRNRKGNLLTGTAPMINSTAVKTMIETVRTMVGTTCGGTFGSTNNENAQLGIKYAKDKGYSSSTSLFYGPTSGLTTGGYFNLTKQEINAGRPILLHLQDSVGGNNGHSAVGYGYKSTGTQYIVRMNLGGGALQIYTGTNGVQYYTATIDQNLNAIFYNNISTNYVRAATTFKIQ